MWSDIPGALVGLLAGPLAVAGVAKALTPPERLAWPFRRGVLRPPWGPRLTGLAELALAVALVALPVAAGAAVALAAYGTLAAVAYRLRGERCACFGPARLASVGRVHVGANAAGGGLAALALAVLAATGPGGHGTAVRLGAGILAGVATVAAVLLLDARGRRDRRAGGRPAHAGPCPEMITGVRLYLTEGCPSCRALGRLLETVEPARRAAVTTTVVGRGDRLPAPLTGLGLPCAVGTGADGTPVCGPAEGIGAVKALVDRVTVRAEPRTEPRAAADAR